MNLETSAIVEAIKAGSEKILFQLYEVYRNEFVSWAMRNHQIDEDSAKDIFQDAMVAFYKNIKSGKVAAIETSVKTYLFSIAKNNILNTIKRKTVENKVYQNMEIEQHSDELKVFYDQEYLVDVVKRIYTAMGSPCKEILEMYYQKGYDMDSIAIAIGYKNADVAKKKKYECLKFLEDRISISKLKNIIR